MMDSRRQRRNERQRAWRKRNPKSPAERERHRLRERERYRNNAEYRARQLELKRQQSMDDDTKTRKNEQTKEWTRTRKYGLPPGRFLEILEEQSGKCKLCDRPLQDRAESQKDRPQIDHCHKSGKVRGILCIGCNTALHLIDKVSIRRIQEYLELAEESSCVNGACELR